MAFASDWVRPTRHQAATPFFSLLSGQWRYADVFPDKLASPLGTGRFKDMHIADMNALGARLGWLPSFPSFDRNSLELVDEAERAGVDPAASRRLRTARRDGFGSPAKTRTPPQNHPRVMTVWRANLLGSSGKGHEYFLKHMLGAAEPGVRAEEAAPEHRPRDVTWREAPEAKLDLFTTIDFRMTSNALFSDVVLPAATWYEKHDLSTTDLHPFVHTFNPAIPPPWEARTDWDSFKLIAEKFSQLAEKHLGSGATSSRRRLPTTRLTRSPSPTAACVDWRAGECEPIPGTTMPKLIVVERDYPNVAARHAALGPLVETLGATVKGASWKPIEEVEWLGRQNGLVRGGVADGRPSLDRVEHACEAILALSGTTNGRIALEGFRSLEERCGVPLASLAEPRAAERITFADAQVQPRTVLTSPEWSGIDEHGRRYSPFTINVERDKPWHTLSGRQHFYLDHEWMLELGEGLPNYRPPLVRGNPTHLDRAGGDRPELALRYLTPHSKWSIHSEYQDNLHMLTLFRGGAVLWLSREDAETLAIGDNDWVEAYNRNGVMACRATVSHRIPKGVCLMYHAKDRHLQTPRTELLGNRGGTDNSVTRIVMKPSHMIGGYAQLSYGFNYYGPTGSQRDEVVLVRRRESEVEF